jgi:hypothetical protein
MSAAEILHVPSSLVSPLELCILTAPSKLLLNYDESIGLISHVRWYISNFWFCWRVYAFFARFRCLSWFQIQATAFEQRIQSLPELLPFVRRAACPFRRLTTRI